MNILEQYYNLEASLVNHRASLSADDPDYQIVATALKELRRSLVAYGLTRQGNLDAPFDNELHPMTNGSR